MIPSEAGKKTCVVRKSLQAFLLLFFSLCFSLLAAETVFRIFFKDAAPSAGPSRILVHEASDNLKLLYQPSPGAASQAYGVFNQINSAGFRGPETSLSKPAGMKRVIFLGDSVVYGYGLENTAAIPPQLEQAFKKSGRGEVEVLNFGVSGYETEQAVEFFKEKGLAFQPDMVIAGYTLNDSIYASMELDFFHDQADRKVKVERPEPRQKIMAFLFRHSRLMKYLDLKLDLQRRFRFFRSWREQGIWHYLEDRNKRTQDPLDSPYQQVRAAVEAEAVRRGTSPEALKKMLGFTGIGNDIFYSSHWNVSRAALEELARLSSLHGFRLAAVIFPYHVEMEHYALGPMHGFLKSQFESMGYRVLDLQPWAEEMEKNKKEVFSDPIHLNAEGARLAGEEIRRFLTEGENAF